MRCASLDTPIPFNLDLEKNFMAYTRLSQKIEQLMKY
jgi:2-oxoisovalerate dehydrogenase E1 component